MTKRAKIQKHLLRQFTSQWHKDYLLNLRENHKNKHETKSGSKISLGDVVLLKDDSTKRIFWKLAIVEELLEGSDGQVCAAVVKVVNLAHHSQLFWRSVKHLYPLEVSTAVEITSDESGVESGELLHSEQVRPPERRRRDAAVIGELRRIIN